MMQSDIYQTTIEQAPMVTIILPVYKVEQYVSKAIESILAQRKPDGSPYTDWEMIAVDDGSPDNSGTICEQYAAADSRQRIHVLHQDNAGAPAARNNALRYAKGKYLFFMDSDDWAEPDMLFDMVWMAENNNAELVIAGFFIDTYTKVVMKKQTIDDHKSRYMTTDYIPAPAVYETKEAFRQQAYALFDRNMLYQPWNKLYLRSYLEEQRLEFPQTYRDDFPFVLSYIRDVERVVVTDRQYYHFLRARTDSETQKYVPQLYEKREEEHGWMEEIYHYWGLEDQQEAREMIGRRYIDRLIECCENLTNPRCDLKPAEKELAIRAMLHNPRVKSALKAARPHRLYSKLMYLPIRLQSTTLTMLEAKTITFVRTHSTGLFTRLKAGR